MHKPGSQGKGAGEVQTEERLRPVRIAAVSGPNCAESILISLLCLCLIPSCDGFKLDRIAP